MLNEALEIEEAVVEEEEVNLVSLITSQSDEDKIDETDADEMPETVEELQAALIKEREIKSKRNKSLRKSKQAQHRTQEENDDLKQRLDRLEQRVADGPSTVGAEKQEQQAQAWRDRFEDDPGTIMQYTDERMSQMADNVVNLMQQKFGEFEERLGTVDRATDPEYVQYRDQIEQLKQRDGFSELDDATLLQVIKGLSGTKIKKPRGTIAGGKPFHDKTGKFVVDDELRAKMGFAPRGTE